MLSDWTSLLVFYAAKLTVFYAVKLTKNTNFGPFQIESSNSQTAK